MHVSSLQECKVTSSEQCETVQLCKLINEDIVTQNFEDRPLIVIYNYLSRQLERRMQYEGV